MAEITVVLPSVLQPLAGGQSFLTAPADAAVTVEAVLELVTGEYPALSRRLRVDLDERTVGAAEVREEHPALAQDDARVQAGQEVLIIQSVAGG